MKVFCIIVKAPMKTVDTYIVLHVYDQMFFCEASSIYLRLFEEYFT